MTGVRAEKNNININSGIHNRFDIEVVDAVTGEVKQRAQAENVICNQLWSRMFNSNSDCRNWFMYLHYGTGVGTPSIGDTSLFTPSGSLYFSSSDDKKIWEHSTKVYTLKRKAVLDSNVAVGVTLTEVGIGYSNSSMSLCTHAMLKDVNGTQISITKTATDIVNIYATVFVHCANIPSWITGYEKSPYFFDYLTGIPTNKSWPLFGAGIILAHGLQDIVSKTPTILLDSANKQFKVSDLRFDAGVGNGYSGADCVTASSMHVSINSEWYTPPQIIGEVIGTGDGTTKDFATAFTIEKNPTAFADGVQQINVVCDLKKPAILGNQNMSDLYYVVQCVDCFGYRKAGGIFYGGEEQILYNPDYDIVGISQIKTQTYSSSARLDVDVSNDLIAWKRIASNVYGIIPIPSGDQNCKYFKLTALGGTYYSNVLTGITPNLSGTALRNVHFSTPPSQGAVITASYMPQDIAKDENHVFDFSMTIQLGTYTPV